MIDELLSTPEVAVQAARLSSVTLLSCSQDNSFRAAEAAKNIMHTDFIESDSSISAAAGAVSLEKRALVTSEVPNLSALTEAAAMRIPLLIFAPSHPENIMALRDSGCLIIFCETHQELLDSIIRGYRLCEDSKVLLPCLIVWDGPLSYYEPLMVPSDQMIRNFLPAMRLPHRLELKKKSSVGLPENIMELRQQQQKAMENAMKLSLALDEQWNKKFKRSWPPVEFYKTEDADLILVTFGYHSSTAKAAINTLRSQGKKAGLVRIRVYRPFPYHSLNLLKSKKVAVLDFSSSPGSFSPLYQEIKPLCRQSLSFISLQKYLNEKDFLEIFTKLEKSEKEEVYWI